MVALLILSVGILQIAAAQIKSLSLTELAYHRSIAASQIISLQEKLLVAVGALQRAHEFNTWQEENAKLLPNAKGTYHCNQTCKISLYWKTDQEYCMSDSNELC